jgi:hypothetical protein
MEKNSAYIALEKELEPLKVTMDRAIDAILAQEVTDYPIFIVHQQNLLEMGVPLLKGGTIYSKWSVNASSLEELATKRIIEQNKIEDFQEIYKDPKTHFCLFVLEDASAKFVFLPR